MKNNKEILSDILAHLDNLSHIRLDKIPEIDLYMDQVTSFMEDHLTKTKRNPEDKVLTKTRINNYAKNRLLPPPSRRSIPGSTSCFCSLSIITRAYCPSAILNSCLPPLRSGISAPPLVCP